MERETNDSERRSPRAVAPAGVHADREALLRVLRTESNPPNPWSEHEVEWLGDAPPVRTTVLLEDAKSLLSRNDSPDIPFRYSINPYRGCAHACAYCYARPSHQWLGFGAGTDFDSRIVVKRNAPEVLARELAKKSWRGDTVCVSGNTDPYQPLEASYRLTRRCLEVLLAADNPVTAISKGALIRRDAELFAALAAGPGALVHISIPTADEEIARCLEPGAPTPAVRFETLRHLARAGVPVGVAVAPVIFGLTDTGVAEVLARAAEAGATRAFSVPLRLPAEVAPVFVERLRAAFPGRAERVLAAQREARGGRLNDPRFGERMRGGGPRVDAMHQLFAATARRFGLLVEDERSAALPLRPPRQAPAPRAAPPPRERRSGQGLLFDG